MFRSYGILISLMGLALVVGLGCESPSGDTGTGGTGGTAGIGGGPGGGGDGGDGGTGGTVMVECPPNADAPEPQIGTVPTACRNSFNQVVSEFPVTLDVALDCAIAGQPFNATVTPTLALDTTFLQSAADTLCVLGNPLTDVTIRNAQVRVDALQGATCTSQLSVLTPVPQDVMLNVTVTGTCGEGGSIVVNEGISIPLSQVSLPCTAGAAGETAAFCPTGTTALMAGTTPNDTFVVVFVQPFEVGFDCGGPATIAPPPGDENDVGCILANPGASTPNGLSCEADVGTATFGETPWEASDCNTADGPPTPNQMCDVNGNLVPCTGTCETIPVAVDPATECVTFTIEEPGAGGAGGEGGAGGNGGAGGAGGGGGA